MKTFDKVPTQQFWEAIEHNARMGQRHVNWVEYLDNIKVLCALIDERVQAHQRRMRLGQVYREHRGVFQLNGAGAGTRQESVSSGERAASRDRGDTRGL